MFGNSTVGVKLMTVIGAVVVATLALGGFGLYSVNRLSHSLEGAITADARQLELVNTMRANAWEAETQKRGAYLGATLGKMEMVNGFESRFQTAMARLRERMTDLDALRLTDADRASLNEMKSVANDYEPLVRQFLALVKAGKANEVGPLVEKIVPLVDRFDQIGTAMATRGSERLAETRQAAESLQATSLWITLGLLLVAVLASIAAVVVIRSVIGNLRGITSELAHGSEEVASAAGQVSSTAQSMSQAANEQAASLEQTSASSEELNSMTQKNAENSREAARGMEEAGRLIQETNQHLESMLTSMRAINDSSEKISKIIKVIDEIAFQTNILALNAAVEAARAGEAGMGFAVVADEVRNLAQRSAQAAKDTASLIEDSILRSNEGSAKLDEVARAIRKVSESAEAVKTLVSEVSLGSQEQARGIDQIAKAITQMEQVTQQVASNAEESAAASEELNAQAETLDQVVSRLSGMVGGGVDRRATGASGRGAKPRRKGLGASLTASSMTHSGQLQKLQRALVSSKAATAKTAAPKPAAALAVRDEFPMDDHFEEF
jgi:methyl-accepting chemotaxis protein/methyl-accepting chemotaxis protein-1 (serine sensor receptor)